MSGSRWSRTITLRVGVVALWVAAGCTTRMARPYARGAAPPESVLLDAVHREVPAVRVPKAKIRMGRAPRGTLAYLAEPSGRLRAQIGVAGNELATVAVHEGGYTFRNHLGAWPEGFYEGEDPTCALAALFGLRLSPQALVQLFLGSVPLPEKFGVIERLGWDRRRGEERIRLGDANDTWVLGFRPHGGSWWLRSARLEQHGRWIVSIEHEPGQTLNGHVLPARTVLTAPGRRRPERVDITYREISALAPPSAEDEWGDDEWGDEEADEGSGDEDDHQDEGQGAPDPAGAGAQGPGHTDPTAASNPASTPRTKPLDPIYVLSADGLKRRGDLCRP